jgi:serine/threonine-protein kinase
VFDTSAPVTWRLWFSVLWWGGFLMVGPEWRALGSRYQLVERIGHGGMGEVWRAWDQQSERMVAAKLLHRHFVSDPGVVARFVQERSLLMMLRHPNIVTVLDMVVEGDDVAIVMELIEAGSLRGYLDLHRTAPAGIAVSVTMGILKAVVFAHEHGVLHRDIKPDNVLLASDVVPSEASARLSDFGIARIAQESIVQATGLLGTPAYMPPEMFESGQFSQASDIYAVGTVLYALLAGRTPFEGGGSAMAVGMRHVYAAIPPIPIPADLWRLLEMMLAKDPRTRLNAASVLSMLQALPDDVLASPALPLQGAPDSWGDFRSRSSLGHDLHVRAVSGDVGQTFMPNADGKALTPTPVSGVVQPLVAQPTIDSTGQTFLVGEHERATDPVLASQVPALAQRRRPRWLAPAIILAVLVVGAVIGFFVVRWAQTPPQTPPISYTAGHVVGTQLPSGLRIDLDAVGGSEPNTVALTVGLNADPESGLTGAVLVALPAQDGQCPTFTTDSWAQPVVKVTQSTDGVTADCGYRTMIAVDPGQTADIEFIVSAVTVADLQAWVDDVRAVTQAALDSVTGQSFALQRVQGIQLRVDSVVVESGTANVVYSVEPIWPVAAGGADDPAQAREGSIDSTPLLTDATLDFQETDLLLELTGGRGVEAVTLTGCDAVQVIGHRMVARFASDNCSVGIRVGATLTATTSFSIRMLPS